MNPNNVEVKPEAKIDQVQAQHPIAEVKKEVSPEIKSEENQNNWKAFREKRESERKAKEDAERRANEKAAEAQALREALEASMRKPASTHQNRESDSDDIEETEEQRIDRKVEAAIKQREAKAQEERLQREQQELPYRLKQSHPDFDQVCSQENIDYIEYHHPEIAKAFGSMPNNFENLSTIYKAMKKLLPNSNVKKDELKANNNLNKPGSISKSGTSPEGTGVSSARLSEERRAENWARMQRSLKGLT